MKRSWWLVPVLLLLMFGVLVSGSAMARGGRSGGSHGGGGHSGFGHGGFGHSGPSHGSGGPVHSPGPAGPSHAPSPTGPGAAPGHGHGPSLAPGPGHGPSYAPSHGPGGGVGYGIALGVPFFGPGYYADPYPFYSYPDPAYGYPGLGVAPSGEYIEQGVPQEALTPDGYWYYCADSNAYYPYVTDCPAGWQRVPAQPPR